MSVSAAGASVSNMSLSAAFKGRCSCSTREAALKNIFY